MRPKLKVLTEEELEKVASGADDAPKSRARLAAEREAFDKMLNKAEEEAAKKAAGEVKPLKKDARGDYHRPNGQYANKEEIAAAEKAGKVIDKSGGAVAQETADVASEVVSGRNIPGTVTGGEKLSNVERMMRGKEGNIGVIPKEIADKMRGRHYSSFDAFREDFWKTVADSRYASEFPKSDIERMRDGFAPKVLSKQSYGQLDSYVLHHEKPIHAGGGVYDLDNITIVTPRMHQEILNKSYHFGY